MLFRHFLVIGIGQGVSIALQICGDPEGFFLKQKKIGFSFQSSYNSVRFFECRIL
jgi:hypothetical protein